MHVEWLQCRCGNIIMAGSFWKKVARVKAKVIPNTYQPSWRLISNVSFLTQTLKDWKGQGNEHLWWHMDALGGVCRERRLRMPAPATAAVVAVVVAAAAARAFAASMIPRARARSVGLACGCHVRRSTCQGHEHIAVYQTQNMQHCYIDLNK